jgi:glycosyltransferase involved in cell wall biosynthesis
MIKIIQAINSIDGFIAVSNAVKELHIFHEPLFKDKPIDVIYNPVIIPNKYIEYSLSMNPQQKNILYASGFQAAKGIHVLLSAFNYVLKSEPNAKLVITRGLGDPGLIKLMNKLNVNRNNIVVLLGHLNRYELFKTYAESSVVTVPSIWPEPLSNVAVESNRLGVPVVASKIGGLSEVVIDGETGYLIKPNVSEELAEALIKALSINWDRRKIYVLTSNRFDPAKSVKHILRFFSGFL